MMKRFVSLLLAAMMLLSLAACGTNEKEQIAPSDSPTIDEQSPSPDIADAPTSEPSEEPSPAPTNHEDKRDEDSDDNDDTTTAEPSTAPTDNEGNGDTQTSEPSVIPAQNEADRDDTTPDCTTPVPPTPEVTAEPTTAEPSTAPTATAFWEDMCVKYEETTPMLMELGEDEVTELYGIDMSAVDDFFAAMPMMSVHINQVFIAHVTGDMDAVKAACENRQQELLGGFLYPMNVDLVENYKLVTAGEWICFVIHEDAEGIANDFIAAFGD